MALPQVARSELASLARILTLPLARWANPLPPPGTDAHPPVVLVHGYLGSPDQLRSLHGTLHHAGFPLVRRFGYPSLSCRLDEIVSRLDALVAPLSRVYGPVDLVGHSLGAVACRAYVKAFGGAEHVRRLVSLGGPHAGTALWWAVPKALQEVLDPDGPWVRRLAQGPEPVPTTVIRSRYDHQVWPPLRAALPGVREVILTTWGHNGLLFAEEAHAAVVTALTEPRSGAGS